LHPVRIALNRETLVAEHGHVPCDSCMAQQLHDLPAIGISKEDCKYQNWHVDGSVSLSSVTGTFSSEHLPDYIQGARCPRGTASKLRSLILQN
jgi:hypothetical protein